VRNVNNAQSVLADNKIDGNGKPSNVGGHAVADGTGKSKIFGFYSVLAKFFTWCTPVKIFFERKAMAASQTLPSQIETAKSIETRGVVTAQVKTVTTENRAFISDKIASLEKEIEGLKNEIAESNVTVANNTKEGLKSRNKVYTSKPKEYDESVRYRLLNEKLLGKEGELEHKKEELKFFDNANGVLGDTSRLNH
jgi:hypothetical protein